MMQRTPAALLLAAILLTGCSFNKLKPEAEGVRVVGIDDVESCKKLGRTVVTAPPKIGFVKVADKKLASELEIIARNSAAKMHGNAIVAIGPIKDGERTYAIYRCK